MPIKQVGEIENNEAMQFTVLNTTGKSTTIEASDVVFGTTVNKVLIAQAVRVYLSNKRQGTAKTKTRSEVSRTTKKWYKQKGTGNARHGAKSANIFVGGGVVHGPTGHENWSLKMPSMMKKKALMSALSAQRDHIVVTTVLSDIEPKTKDAVAFLQKLAPDSKRTLIILDKKMENIERSMNNLPQVLITHTQQLSILDVVTADALVFTKEAIKAVEERILASVGQKKNQAVSEVKKEPSVKKVAKSSKVVKEVKKTSAKKVKVSSKS